MPTRQSPTVRLRRLGTLLRKMREDQGLTIAEAAQQLRWDRTKLDRIEKGVGTLPQIRNTEALLDLYRVVGDDRDEAIDLTIQARQRSWWHPLKDDLEAGYFTYIGLEDEASGLRVYDASTVPSLLQTDGYAAATISGQMPGITADAADLNMRVMTHRREVLHADPPLDLWAIVDEAALRRMVGSPQVMRDQLTHLVEIGKLPHIHLQVLPFSAGAHAGVCPFAILDFAESVDPEVVYLRTVARAVWMEDPDHVVRFRLAFESLIEAAMNVRASRTFIEKLLTELD